MDSEGPELLSPLLETVQSKEKQLQSENEDLRKKLEEKELEEKRLKSENEKLRRLLHKKDQNRLPEPRFDNDYELKGELGKGGFGIVYHVEYKTDSGEYALKRIHCPAEETVSKVMREVKALAKLDHPYIVRYYFSWVEKAPVGWEEMEKWMPLSQSKVTSSSSQSPKDHHQARSNHSQGSPPNLSHSTTDSRNVRDGSQPASSHEAPGTSQPPSYQMTSTTDPDSSITVEPPTYLFIQMELCKKESLKDWLRSTSTDRPHAKVMSIFNQIMDAVMYVHSNGMMHRDLKPSNIFFSQEGNVKVGDFGLVTSLEYDLLGNGQQQQHRKQHTGDLGSHFYRSPELKQGGKRVPYDQKVDVYSLGVIFFELHCLFDTNMERAKVLEDVNHDKFPENFESKLPHQAKLVKQMMKYDASERPDIKGIYDSEEFQLIKENMLDKVPKL